MRNFTTALLGVFMWTFGLQALAAETDQAPSVKNREECIFSRRVFDWHALDDNNLVVWTPGNRDAYLVKIIFPLTGLRFDSTIAFVDGDRDGRLCGHGRDSIAERDNLPGAQKSSITSISRLDAAGIAALEAKYKTSLSRERGKKKNPSAPEPETAK